MRALASLDPTRAVRSTMEVRRRRDALVSGAATLAATLASRSRARAVGEATIEILDDVAGSGATPLAGVDVARVNYEVRLSDALGGARVDAGKFFTFGVGTGEVVRGFDELVSTMRVGGKRRAIVPAALAYGDRGAGCNSAGEGCRIPPGADLVFYVELLELR